MAFRPSARALAAVSLAAPALLLGPLVHHHGPLTDLQPAASTSTDGARGSVSAVASGSGTLVVLRVTGLDRDAAGQTFAAHVHVGRCVTGDASAVGPHYNHDVVTGHDPVRVSPDTEVWLDFTVRPGGTAYAVARVPFTIEPGDASSVAMHPVHTGHMGAAGGPVACLPVHF